MTSSDAEPNRSTTAIDYPDVDALPTDLQDALRARGSINVYRMVMHSPGLAPGFLAMADAVLRGNSLPADLRELAIIRVGHVYGAAYEVHHHERIGRACGLSDAALDAARHGGAENLSDTERAILRWTDLLLRDHRLDGEQRSTALDVLGVTQLTDLVLTVGFYQLVCNFLSTFEIDTVCEVAPRLPRTQIPPPGSRLADLKENQ